jgi:hypothetical protein
VNQVKTFLLERFCGASTRFRAGPSRTDSDTFELRRGPPGQGTPRLRLLRKWPLVALRPFLDSHRSANCGRLSMRVARVGFNCTKATAGTPNSPSLSLHVAEQLNIVGHYQRRQYAFDRLNLQVLRDGDRLQRLTQYRSQPRQTTFPAMRPSGDDRCRSVL